MTRSDLLAPPRTSKKDKAMVQSKDSKASWELLRTVFHLPTALCNVSALNTPFQRLSQNNDMKTDVFQHDSF